MFKMLKDQLTQREAVTLLDLSYQSLSCNKEEKFKALVLDLREVLPFEHGGCANGNVADLFNEEDAVIGCCDVNYPPGYLEFYFEQNIGQTDTILLEFLANLSPVNWHNSDKKCGFSEIASVRAQDFKMIDGWSYGTLDPKTMNSTVFFFGSPDRDRSLIRNKAIVEYATPFLSIAYERVLKNETKPCYQLTNRETAVLSWIKEGKSSWEISQILKCSERTVNFHVTNIKTKLGVVSRAQAVAVGLQFEIIQF